ncbi:hypothetical protein DC522_27315 [Microvirga sp. KLBC 81]|nr:hypothetical protein DC522_27315 [Microvirga sp. KLBC 81]
MIGCLLWLISHDLPLRLTTQKRLRALFFYAAAAGGTALVRVAQQAVYALLLHASQAELRIKAPEQNPVRLYPGRGFVFPGFRAGVALGRAV